ncbi:ATP-binding protein [Phyllobacterium zundukense]|uniref:ATP-binding protein n=1 Tax=Phyllobacterium zundukense TaxID=1867719 RepID=A0A2N9W4E9_9HYPH|nr:ATP-binding protein [Phyllobacterium zundukense]ATU91914.1 hypothetical protein BLM14_09970 [Phyllobacterium zundukense]PIO46617.1 hypothetical protein B5P45_02110 [Phyllobacterium zundukense]
MVDDELKKTDGLLSRLRGDDLRFSAKRVSNLETPMALTDSVRVRGWKPIDTAFSISDIPRLVEKLGGEQLYGNDKFPAIRELVQNAMDAIRLRRLVDPEAPEGGVTVHLSSTGSVNKLIVSDNGVGMSASTIVESLLSFGSSGWLNDPAIGEFSENLPDKSDISGKYGIGFFSIFMLGKRVWVKTRRFDKSVDDTIVLEFRNGLDERPILFAAEGSERKVNGGTTIEIELDAPLFNELLAPGNVHELGFQAKLAVTFPTSNVPISLELPGVKSVIDGRRWKEEPGQDLLRRVEGQDFRDKEISKYAANLRPLWNSDNELIGRMCVVPRDFVLGFRRNTITGSVVSNGAKVTDINFRGVVEGQVQRASRDTASPIWSARSIADWASEQAQIIAAMEKNVNHQLSCAEYVVACGGNSRDLKVCETSIGYLSFPELQNYLKSVDHVWLAHDAALSIIRRRFEKFVLSENVIFCSMGTPALFPSGRYDLPVDDGSIGDLIVKEIAQEFQINNKLLNKYMSIVDGEYLYDAKTIFGRDKNGNDYQERAKYFCRNMTESTIKTYRLNKNHRVM